MSIEKHSNKIQSIGFFGLSDYGFGILKWLVDESDYKVSFVTGKSKKVYHVSGIEKDLIKYCYDKKLTYLGNVNVNDLNIVELAKKTDLCIIGGYDKILKSSIINAPKFGVINTHFAIIPYNRGCNPTMWAILKNIPQGSTTYYVNENIDHGDIISIVRDDNLVDVTAREAYDRITELSLEDFPNVMKNIEEGKSSGVPKEEGRYFKQGLPNDGYLSFDLDKDYLKRFSDALWFPPYKPARFKSNGKEYFVKILKVDDNKIKCEIYDEDTNF